MILRYTGECEGHGRKKDAEGRESEEDRKRDKVYIISLTKFVCVCNTLCSTSSHCPLSLLRFLQGDLGAAPGGREKLFEVGEDAKSVDCRPRP